MGRTTGAPAVRVWLYCVWALILVMVVLGGITRLTGSGLSMVEWQPLMGALPPSGEAEWHAVFDQYKQSPQYLQVNHWMRLEDFKRIFFWEYFHRLFGRLVGAAFLLPWLYFLVRRRLGPWLARRTFVAFGLGGLQGLLGWYMVQSGLVDQPRVSHLRLAAHLMLAFTTGMWVLWLATGLQPGVSRVRSPLGTRVAAWALVALVALQCVYGAFMAGTHAGLYYGTFPDMHGVYLPQRFFFAPTLSENLLHNPAAIHWTHRFLGWLVLALALGLCAYFYRAAALRVLARAGAVVALFAFVQFNLGALTVVERVPIGLAVMHQGMAYLVLSASVVLLHRALGGSSDEGRQAALGDGRAAGPG